MKIANKEVKAVDLVREALEKAEKFKDHHCFISLNEELALKQAKEIDERIARGEEVGKLAGVPYALKDNYLSMEGMTTAAAKMLENFSAPITATAVKKLRQEGAIMIGRTNLDAYAHGSSTENSYFGPTLNAYDKERVAGGSSGGSAVAVALDIVQFALGSDTGGSIRQPANFNGVVGVKPTFGTVSRYGVVAMASSTDTMGCFAKDVDDADLVMSVIAGKDKKDSTTLEDFWYGEVPSTKNMKIGVIREFMSGGVDSEVLARLEGALEKWKQAGHEIVDVDMPMLKYGLAIYYIVQPAEVASNLSRYDGVRYGYRAEGIDDLAELYGKTRDAGFMTENKRRIMIGNFVLSSGFFDAYYLKAQKARTLLIRSYEEVFKTCDALFCPVTASPAFKLGEKTGDPLKMYLEDLMSVPPSLAGLPAMSIPCGMTESGLPVGLQLIGPRKSDRSLLGLAKELEY